MSDSPDQPPTPTVSFRERLARFLLVGGILLVIFHLQDARGHAISLDIGLVNLEHRVEATSEGPSRVLTRENLRHLHVAVIDGMGDTVVEASFAFDPEMETPAYVNTGDAVIFAGTYRVVSRIRFESESRVVSTERQSSITIERDGPHPVPLE